MSDAAPPLGPARPRPARSDPALVMAGMTRLSTVDWPGKLVATVFTQGCPWRCGYCQNPDLIDPRIPAALEWPEVMAFLARRRGLLDGVVFTGGEPTLYPGLRPAMAEVRDAGFAVGLHTGGAWPTRLEALVPLVDWVGLDIKHLPDRYDAVTGAGPSGAAAFRSLDLLLASGVDLEVRTTVAPTVHARHDVLALAQLLQAKGVRRYVLQEARVLGASPEFGARLAGRRLSDVLHDDDLPGVERRVA